MQGGPAEGANSLPALSAKKPAKLKDRAKGARKQAFPKQRWGGWGVEGTCRSKVQSANAACGAYNSVRFRRIWQNTRSRDSKRGLRVRRQGQSARGAAGNVKGVLFQCAWSGSHCVMFRWPVGAPHVCLRCEARVHVHLGLN